MKLREPADGVGVPLQTFASPVATHKLSLSSIYVPTKLAGQ